MARVAGGGSVSHRKPVTADELKRIGLFGALSSEVLDHLAQTLPTVEPDPGDLVFKEGDTARELFVLLEGEAEVVKRSRSGVDARVAVLGPGDWFGEMAVLDVQPRSASVRALAPSRLLRIRATDLDALYRHDLKAYALVVLNIARELSRRLRVTDGILADFLVNVLDVVERRRPDAD
ncbi:MAG: cyclic nucleotide-binding domain-containing protein [Polyangiaceae bacterium]